MDKCEHKRIMHLYCGNNITGYKGRCIECGLESPMMSSWELVRVWFGWKPTKKACIYTIPQLTDFGFMMETECGNFIGQDSKYCPYCGKRLELKELNK